MTADSDRQARDAFHMAKLALTNVRVLADFQSARSEAGEVSNIVEQRLEQDNISKPFSLLHQATFLQFAYICLVWLWEREKVRNNQEELADRVGHRFCFDNVEILEPQEDEGNQSAKWILTRIRNAISHGAVEAQDEKFTFRDREKLLSLSWQELAKLSEAVLFVVNDMVYPTLHSK